MLDVARHYARPDVFELWVHTGERPLIRSYVDSRRARGCGPRGAEAWSDLTAR